jgi:hypothetical protein
MTKNIKKIVLKLIAQINLFLITRIQRLAFVYKSTKWKVSCNQKKKWKVSELTPDKIVEKLYSVYPIDIEDLQAST